MMREALSVYQRHTLQVPLVLTHSLPEEVPGGDGDEGAQHIEPQLVQSGVDDEDVEIDEMQVKF